MGELGMRLTEPESTPGFIGRKQVDWSVFEDGTTIPRQFQQRFIEASGGPMPGPGNKCEITLLIDGQSYPASLIQADRKAPGAPTLRLRYGASKELLELLRRRLHISYAFLRDLRQRAQGAERKFYVKLPPDHAEFLEFYATDTPFCYRLELIAAPPAAPQWWIFQVNPALFDLAGALATLPEITRPVRQHKERIRPGDQVLLWEAGERAGALALATVLTMPVVMEYLPTEAPFWRDDQAAARELERVRLRIDRVFAKRLPKHLLLQHHLLQHLNIIKIPRFSNYLLTAEQAAALQELAREAGTVEPMALRARVELTEVVSQFAHALHTSHVHFGAGHDDFVRTFIAILATKRLLILTGLSGSGKTQIAQRFGEWLGAERLLLLAVRPDWTGPEPLLGYEDALSPAGANGARAWQAPEALRFMLKAAADPYQPYLLILDEMNLAHVERYFADVLSGMESDQPCLPNLQPDGGSWRLKPGAPDKVPFPPNLFVAGTVNVDETTYMFSPKVLDRANTLEFRVATADLVTQARRPAPCSPGASASVQTFLAIASDPDWHLQHQPPDEDAFVQQMRTLHVLLLDEGDFAFGHRLFYEAVRYAAIFRAAGGTSVEQALDRQVLQKVLPRLHGTRRRLEPLLLALMQFCFDLTYTPGAIAAGAVRSPVLTSSSSQPRLPLSFDKLRRMLSILRANQYVTFTG